MSDSDKPIKIILLGESGVGKTSLIRVFFGLNFKNESESTFSSICYEYEFIYNDKKYKYSIWDTAGQEAYRSINKLIIREAKIILIVYAINNKNSFDQIDFWIKYVRDNIEDDKYIMALVANKMDLFEEQMIMDEEGRDAAEKYGIEFLTTSARENIQSFKTFTNNLIANYIENFGECLDSISLKKRIKINEGKKSDKSNRKKCCD